MKISKKVVSLQHVFKNSVFAIILASETSTLSESYFKNNMHSQ